MRATLKMLLPVTVTFAFAQGSSAPPDLTSIIERMERAQSAISIPTHVTRDYQLGRPGSAKVDSDVLAEVDFRTGKYTVKKRSGSSAGEVVVKRCLEHEVAIAASSQKSRAAAVTRENYVFSEVAESVLDGSSYYLLKLAPKRPKQPELISGQVWVDKKSFLIRRIEGGVKSPSWWVKKIHVRFDFDSAQGMWVLNNMEAVADVRYLGARKLTSTSHVDEAVSVVAKTKPKPKIGRVRSLAAASVLK
jgi:hypothetical protein